MFNDKSEKKTTPVVWQECLGSGNYNNAMRHGNRVFKYQNNKVNAKSSTDSAERSTRLFNQINGHLGIKAELLENQVVIDPQSNQPEIKSGWTCPFIEGQQASDAEISKELIKIFNRTRRIVMDAPGDKNFLKTKEGLIICIDIGMALELEATESQALLDPNQSDQSLVSNNVWRQLKPTYTKYFQHHQSNFPETVNTLKALIFIREHSLMHDASCLERDPALINQFARAYDLQLQSPGHEDIKKAEDQLNQIKPATFENLKNSCIEELERYINSRGSMIDNKFSPSLITRFFRNVELTRTKVTAANELITELKSASVDDLATIREKILQFRKNEALTKAGPNRTSGLDVCLKICSLIMETVPKEALGQEPRMGLQ